MSDRQNRSFETITRADLRRLSKRAHADFDSLFERHDRWRPYSNRLMLICLGQGAAQHYVSPTHGTASDRDGGVNDFDLWGFFRARRNERPFPLRRHGRQDFCPSKFGRSPDDPPRFTGRRIDVFGRSVDVRPSEAPTEAVQRFLRECHTNTIHLLAQQPLVVIWPDDLCGKVIWKGQTRVIEAALDHPARDPGGRRPDERSPCPAGPRRRF
jgi:hypothetical protein